MRLTSPLVLLITLFVLSTASAASAATWWRDFDGDTYGDPSMSTESASQPPGYVAISLDCDDQNPAVNPGATEVCNGADDDCDGQVDEGAVGGSQWFADADADGFGDPANMVVACVAPPGYVADGSDCDDTTASINPGAPEVCNGVDDDCDGQVDEGCTPFEITSVLDVPNDQGRRVRVRWTRNNQDVAGAPTPILSYSIYRRIEAGLAPQGWIDSSAPLALMAAPPGDWDFVVNLPATGESSYSTLAGTLCDSTSSGICWSRFFVRAHTSQPTVFFDTAVDSGTSVDNLAPNVPQNLSGVGSETGMQLDWADNLEEDFGHFRVYRSTDPAFEPGPATLVQSTVASSWTDSATPAGAYSYKVTAVDLNGNESTPAALGNVVGTDGVAPPDRLLLHHAVPNPMRGTVALAVDLPRAGHVRLAVYDARGALVRGLHDATREAGRFVAVWSGSDNEGRAVRPGVYYIRLKALGETQVRKVLLVE
jgi:hypothetical protein